MGEWLKDKVAIVTGSGGGIGRGIALDFASQGARVVVNDLGGASDGSGSSKKPAEQVVEEITKAGGQAVANFDSVSTMEGGERIVKTALDSFGKLDIAVTCAGILRDRMIFNMSEQEWDDVIAVHLKGTFSVCKPASVVMRQQRSGRIINFSSTSGLYGNAGQANYGAAKSGIAGFAKTAALDLGRYGVTVNAIAPMAATRLTVSDEMQEAAERRAQRGEKEQDSVSGPALDQMAPEDVAPMVTYLCSDLAANVNGQVFLVGGGMISHIAPPRQVATIFQPERWTVDGLIKAAPSGLMKGVENPAPAVKPAS